MSSPIGIRELSPIVRVITAGNPGPMTLDGTNSYLLGAADADAVVVVDPGPDDQEHLRRLADLAPVELVLVTHRHHDHTAGAAAFAASTGAPVRAADPAHCHGGGRPLADGEVIEAAGVWIRVLATPGHTDDSVCFELPDDGRTGSVLTGDTILGRGTTVIAHPDGALGPYLDSLRLLAGLGTRRVLPGHGPELPDLSQVTAAYLTHREQRLDAVRAALHTLGRTASVATIVDTVYTDIDPAVRPAAELSVRAQLDYLSGR